MSASAPGCRCRTIRATTKLCGVDISEPMLRKAQARVRALGLTNVETLAVMDAKNLAFPDGFSTRWWRNMSSPRCRTRKATLDDFIRVLKPGGELILVNHIGAESGPRRIFELAFAPLARRLGWRPEFPWAAAGELGGETWRRQPGRAPPDAADGTFFADPLPQILKYGLFRTERPRPAAPFSCMRMKSTLSLCLCMLTCGSGRRTRRRRRHRRRRRRRRPPPDAASTDCSPMRPVPPRGTERAGGHDHRPEPEPLGDKLAKSDGVLCPPSGVDPEMRAPTPDTGNTPVIPPPGSPGGDPTVRPK